MACINSDAEGTCIISDKVCMFIGNEDSCVEFAEIDEEDWFDGEHGEDYGNSILEDDASDELEVEALYR